MFVLAFLIMVLTVSSATWLPRTVTAPSTEYHCTSLLLGRKTEDMIELPVRVVGSHDYLYIANYCSGQQKKLAGEDVKVCDTVGAYPPSVTAVRANRFSPLRVDCPPQNEPCTEIIYECYKQQKKWVGANVTACDSVGFFPPTVIPFGAGSFSPLYINCAQENPHPCYELIIVHVTLYCGATVSPNSL